MLNHSFSMRIHGFPVPFSSVFDISRIRLGTSNCFDFKFDVHTYFFAVFSLLFRVCNNLQLWQLDYLTLSLLVFEANVLWHPYFVSMLKCCRFKSRTIHYVFYFHFLPCQVSFLEHFFTHLTVVTWLRLHSERLIYNIYNYKCIKIYFAYTPTDRQTDAYVNMYYVSYKM